MSKIMCPGQDTRYWRPEDIFEIECGNCKSKVEFFKDDASRKCKKCGTKIQNPKLNMGCAQWCEHAKECLGYDPKVSDDESAKLDASISVKLLRELKKEFGEDSDIYNNSLKRYSRITKAISDSEANPGLTIVAALLLEVDNKNSTFNMTKKIMSEIDLDKIFIDEVCDLITKFHKNETAGSKELQLISNII